MKERGKTQTPALSAHDARFNFAGKFYWICNRVHDGFSSSGDRDAYVISNNAAGRNKNKLFGKLFHGLMRQD
jgi:hypothetical protein